MNIMGADDVNEKVNNISHEVYKMAGLKIRQVEGFVPGTDANAIEPGMTYKMLTPEKLLFYATNYLVLANTETGTRCRIDF